MESQALKEKSKRTRENLRQTITDLIAEKEALQQEINNLKEVVKFQQQRIDYLAPINLAIIKGEWANTPHRTELTDDEQARYNEEVTEYFIKTGNATLND